jgi:Replication initiator protein A
VDRGTGGALQKSGSNSLLKRFRLEVKNIAKANNLPDYWVSYDVKIDPVTFSAKDAKRPTSGIAKGEGAQPDEL